MRHGAGGTVQADQRERGPRLKLTTGYKLTPTRSGGAHVQIPAIVLMRAGWCNGAGLVKECLVTFSARGGRITMEKKEK